MKKNFIYQEIKNKIITCEYQQGKNINEKELASTFGVSRTPIREALNLLEMEEWIKSVPRKGYVVADITFSNIKDLFQIRYELEPLFLNMAYNFFEKDELEEFKNRILSLVNKKDYEALRIIDDEFHNYLIESTYNNFAIKTMENINEHVRRTRYLTFEDSKETLESAQDHLNIINCLLEKNLAKAEEYLKNHIDKSQLYFLRNFNFKNIDVLK